MTKLEPQGEELEILGRALTRIPTPLAPDVLVSRVRQLGHRELARRSEEKLNRLTLVFLLFFSWTVSAVSVGAARLLGGESVAVLASALSWISSASVLIVVGVYVRREKRLA